MILLSIVQKAALPVGIELLFAVILYYFQEDLLTGSVLIHASRSFTFIGRP